MLNSAHPQLQKLYAGDIYKCSATQASFELIEEVEARWAAHFGPSISDVHRNNKNDTILFKLSQIRAALFGPTVIALQKKLISQLSIFESEFLVDTLRLRAYTPQMLTLPEAEPCYYAHRDTWYGNPQHQINCWIPLRNYNSSESFCFYPQYFQHPVVNDSHLFNYEQWVKQVGWQSTNPKNKGVYPKAIMGNKEQQMRFECRRGEIILFSGQHLHQSLSQSGVQTRVSVDFRVVPMANQQMIQPRNVDNFSVGTTRGDFV